MHNSSCNFSHVVDNHTSFAVSAQCDHLKFCHEYNNFSVYIETVVVVLTVLDVFIILTTILCNGLFIISFFLYQNLKTPSNILLLNLAIVNITFGTFGLISCCLFQVQFVSCQRKLCFFKDMYVYFFATGMSFTLTIFTFVSLERFICIFYALRWEEISTKRRASIVVVLTWVFWLGVSCPLRALDRWDIFENIYLVVVSSSFLILLITNGTILKEIQRHEKRIAHDEISSNSDEIRKAREKKRAKTISLMIALVFLCYIPTILMVMLIKLPSINQVDLQFGWMTCRTIALSHSTFDIVVYGLRTEEIKKAFKKVLNKLRGSVVAPHLHN